MPGNIELQELLNRKTGPGRISPQTPLEARLYGPDGQPLGTQSNPLEVRVRELEAELQELRQTLTSGDAKMQLTGRIAPQVTTLLTDTPLVAGGSYTQTAVDSETYEFPNGSVGAISVSGLAFANVQGTLFIEASADGTTWTRISSAAVNQTGVARLRRTNLMSRFFRFRFFNNTEESQTSFTLYQTVWQTTNGQGDEHGVGEDEFRYAENIPAATTVTVMDFRSAIEVRDIVFGTSDPTMRLYVQAYKDDGSLVYISRSTTRSGTSQSNHLEPSYFSNRNLGLWEITPGSDPGEGEYLIRLRAPQTFAKGLRVRVENVDQNNSHPVRCWIPCRVL